jgi:hypothetical protein
MSETRVRRTPRRLLGVAVVALGCLGLASCVEATNDAAPETALAQAPIAKRDGVSLSAATVALVSLEGAPTVASGDFRQALAQQFVAREIVAVDPKKARYLLRVYLAAAPAEGGANLEYVVDVYDSHRQRAARLDDGLGVNGSGDAWSLMSSSVIDSVAGKCAEDLAAFLSNTPEAAPVAAQALSYVQ